MLSKTSGDSPDLTGFENRSGLHKNTMLNRIGKNKNDN
jgi:hypothetical protein